MLRYVGPAHREPSRVEWTLSASFIDRKRPQLDLILGEIGRIEPTGKIAIQPALTVTNM